MLGQAKLAGVALAIGVVLFEVGSHSACVAQRCPILCGQRCGVSVSSCSQGCAKDEAVPFCWPAARWFLLVVIRNLPWRSAAAFLLGLPISKLHKRPASASPICAMCPQPQSEAQAPAVGPASRARALLARLNQRPAARSSRIQDSASCSPASLICHVHIGSNSHVTNKHIRTWGLLAAFVPVSCSKDVGSVHSHDNSEPTVTFSFDGFGGFGGGERFGNMGDT
jgi:hypothetical protein